MLKNFKFAFLEKELVHNFGQKFEISSLSLFSPKLIVKRVWRHILTGKELCFLAFFAKGLVHDFGEKLKVSSL